MNAPNSSASGQIDPEDYARIRDVFEPMLQKFAKIADSIPVDARPAVRFEASGSESAKS